MVPIKWVGVGPARESIIVRNKDVIIKNIGKEEF